MPSPLLVKAAPGREICNITPEKAGWEHVGFQALRLASGQAHTLETGARELCLVVLTGTVTLEVGDPQGQVQHFADLGRRSSVFEEISPAGGVRAQRPRPARAGPAGCRSGAVQCPG